MRRITPERAARIEEAIRKLRAVKAIAPDDEDADAAFREVAADVLIDLFEDWKELRGEQPMPVIRAANMIYRRKYGDGQEDVPVKLINHYPGGHFSLVQMPTCRGLRNYRVATDKLRYEETNENDSTSPTAR